MKKKAIVLLSGGIDSVTAMYWAEREYREVEAVAFDYGSNHAEHELAFARYHAERLGVPYREIDLSCLKPHLASGLLEGEASIPKDIHTKKSQKQTVVPFRNGIFLAVAAAVAESTEAEAIIIAAHAGDHAIYPDCRPEFMDAIGSAIKYGTYGGIKIVDPFINASKGEIVTQGARLGVDYAHTYSCYCGGEKHCGQCATCRERKEAFAEAGIPDPTKYEK